MSLKGTNKGLRSPMTPHSVGKGKTPSVAPNTVIPGSAPKSPAPLNSPMQGTRIKK